MEPGDNAGAFDSLFKWNVPHILETIFFSLDYKSFMTCMRVNKTWRGLLSTVRYQEQLEELMSEKQENEKKLHNAAQVRNAEEVRRLINDHMVDVNIEFGSYQIPPLIEAAKDGNVEVVQTLLDAGADVDKSDKLRYTPLHWAAMWKANVEVVKILLGTGAEVNKVNRWGKTPLQITNRKDVAKILLKNGADHNKEDQYGNTPLHEVVMFSHLMNTYDQNPH